MSNEIQIKLVKTLEDIKKIQNSMEYWSARDLGPILEYSKWQNFRDVISKAIKSCKTSGIDPDNHFTKVSKMVKVGLGVVREIEDYNLTRYACYLIAQNGSPTKEAIAIAQMYFAVQTRKQEVHQQQLQEIKRLEARKKLSETEKKFAETLYTQGVDGSGIGEIRAVGDQALFGGYTTRQMKQLMKVKTYRPLADFLPTVTLKAKDLAAEITTVNTKQKSLQGKNPIREEHRTNNREVRKLLKQRGITPELLPAEEDVKKIERKYQTYPLLTGDSQEDSMFMLIEDTQDL